jgi:phosphoribosylformylglycinamidine cyclo-ligase
MSHAYAQAGVNIEEANRLVDKIKPLAAKTKRPGVMGGIGGFGALFDPKAAGFKDPILVSTTDGVGTKLKLAIDSNRHETIGIDLVAMCVNDLLVQGATPLLFLDYFATGRLSSDTAATVIAGIAEGCAQADCALIGGETAEMPGMYQDGDYDLAGFTVGAVERGEEIDGSKIAPGDLVLGLASSGVHSNGYSLVRKIIGEAGVKLDAPCPFEAGKNWGDVLLAPTRIYVKPVLKAIKAHHAAIKGMAHITGGGLTDNIPRVLPDNTAVKLNLPELRGVFKWLQDSGKVSAADMAQTFNCGFGYVLIVAADAAQDIAGLLMGEGETVIKLGEVVARNAEGDQVLYA